MNCLLCQTYIGQTHRFLDLLLLRREKVSICSNCYDSFQEISDVHCTRCFKHAVQGICLDCQEWEKKGEVIHHQAIFTYNQAMKEYFSLYKFHGDYLLREVFSSHLKKGLARYADFTIVPIPISSQRMAQRGFNQVTGFLDAGEIDYLELLQKEERKSQSSKGKKERMEQQNPFSMKEKSQVPQKVLLFDDIYTTGATLDFARQILRESGVQEILTFSLAR